MQQTNYDIISSEDVSPACHAASQRLALLLLFNLTGGQAWSNNSGWPAEGGRMGSSMRTDDEEAVRTTAAGDSPSVSYEDDSGECISDASNVTLPGHCCWYGVSCCTSLTCQYAPPSCACDEGLVTALDLGNNNVRCLMRRGTSLCY